MSNHDLTRLLREWPFEPETPQVRLTTAEDGRTVLQVRVPLGLLQMELSGRPDGRPSAMDALNPRDRETPLTIEESGAIREEIHLYQQRAAALLALGEAGEALRDAEWCLALTALLVDLSSSRAERRNGARLRAHVLALRARIVAMTAVRAGQPNAALRTVEQAIDEIRVEARRAGLDPDVEARYELLALESFRDALVPKLPSSQRAELEARLRAAIAAENYELAAILRDELRLMG